MSAVNVNRNNYRDEVLNAEGKVLLDFWAPWCGPCRMVGPILDEIAAERSDVKVCKVNVDEEIELARQFRVASIPMLAVMEGGELLSRSVGARPKADILELLEG